MPTTITQVRTQFFDYLYGVDEGYICVATGSTKVPKGHAEYFKQYFFHWPEQRNDLSSFIESAASSKNVWFCTSLLERAERKKEYCLPGSLVWADLDTCNPDVVEPKPPCVIESSPRRWQAFWRLDEKIEPYRQEDYSRRIAYKYSKNGVDPSGWDLTQLLRVPLTANFKYEVDGLDVPEVKIVRVLETLVPVELFEQIERPTRADTHTSDYEASMPNVLELPSVDNVLYKFWPPLTRTAFKQLYTVAPPADADWSKDLWRLINICIEAGMSEEEVFAITMSAACNKYARDNRPPVHLWEDILRAAEGQKRITAVMSSTPPLLMPELVTSDEIKAAGESFIDTYKDWAIEATDAVSEYHELSAAILLSAVVAGGVKLNTTYGEMVPNLWGLILGDSTLTRKTTAMRMVMDIVADIDPELILATDGSTEGLLTGLSTRPNRTSIFYKDEVSGFIDSINRKDYLAGMPETLTQLYDVPRILTRRLRKETISISSPCFIFFGGGIRDKVYSLVTDEYVLSGFLPRFLIVSGEADLSKIRRTGPGMRPLTERRDKIVNTVANLYETFSQTVTTKVAGQEITLDKSIKAELTDDAWERYGDIEMKMVEAAHASSIPMLALPTFERLSRSGLKLSILLAAAEKPPQGEESVLLVEESHVIKAFSYIQKWGRYTVDLLINSGKSLSERTLMKILDAIMRNPGITRSTIMQHHHLSSKDANEIFKTLEERGQIVQTKVHQGYQLRAV